MIGARDVEHFKEIKSVYKTSVRKPESRNLLDLGVDGK
jgi:hypothetical protein